MFDGINNPANRDINYYYPTNDLVTAPEILFFWVARMIIAGYEYRDEKPFRNVYLTGIVRDQKRRKMSKSLGNSPDPIQLMEKYSADGVRVGMLLCSPAGNDLLFDESLTEQGRNFGNKIWNAFRLVNSWQVDPGISQPETSEMAAKWFDARLNEAIVTMDGQFDAFRLSDALMTVYKLFWDEFSSWYLESIKPEFGKPVDNLTYDQANFFLEKLMALLHPFMPFITEEIWHLVKERQEGESLMISPLPSAAHIDAELISRFEQVKQVITSVRNIRNEKNLPMKDRLTLHYIASDGEYIGEFDLLVKKLSNLSDISATGQKPVNAASFIVKNTEYYIPLEDRINISMELERMNKELEYTRGFLKAVLKKLSNERFVNSAPAEVVERENIKKTDAENKIASLEKQIAALMG